MPASTRPLLALILPCLLAAAPACGDDTASGATTTTSTSGAGGGGSDAAGGASTASSSSSTSGGGQGGTGGSGATGGGGGGETGGGGQGGAGGAPGCGEPAVGPVTGLALELVTEDVFEPILALGAPGDTTRLFVVSQAGTIELLKDGVLQETPFLDLTGVVSDGGGAEYGFLGLAFHPDYATNGRFFVFYTTDPGPNVLVEYARGDTADLANPVPVAPILSINDIKRNHNGGSITFGPDGFLYLSVGDNAIASNAQLPTDQRGKILRIDVDTYPTPVPGNLSGGDPHVLHSGLRNPWRTSVDRCTGDLYIADVGAIYEELNVSPAAPTPQNFGWPSADGPTCAVADCSAFTAPVVAFDHSQGDCAVIGGYVYRGTALEGLRGRYLYGDYCTSRIKAFTLVDGVATDPQDLSVELDSEIQIASISAFGEDTAGNLYVLDYGTNRVHRIVAEPAGGPDRSVRGPAPRGAPR